MATYTFKAVPAWGSVGQFARIGAKKSTTYPVTLPGGGAATVVQGGTTKVGYLESDSNGLIPEWTTTDIASVDVDFGVAVLRVNSEDAITAGAASAAAAADAATAAEDAQTAAESARDDAVAATAGKVDKGSLVVNVLDYGATGNGTTDDTAAIQAAVNAAASQGRPCLVPPGTYLIAADNPGTTSVNYLRDEGGVTLPSNTDLRLDPAAVLQARTNAEKAYNVLRIWVQTNVRVTGGTIRGDRTTHTGSLGEWGYGIAIAGGSDITIENVRAVNCWGDGIDVQRNPDDDSVTKNLTIRGVTCDNNRRQGLSIEGGDGVLVEDSTFSNTNGTAPECGIDIEPAIPDLLSKDITIRDCKFLTNNRNGILALGSGLRNVVIEGNVFDGNKGLVALDAQVRVGTTPASPLPSGVQIRNNTVRNTPAGLPESIRVYEGSGAVISGNTCDRGISARSTTGATIRDNRVQSSTQNGVILSGVTGGRVEGNTIDLTGSTGAEAGVLVVDSLRVKVRRNDIIETGYAIDASPSTGVTIDDIQVSDNVIDNVRSGVARFTRCANAVMRRNSIAGLMMPSGSSAIRSQSGSTLVAEDNDVFQKPRITTTGSTRATYAFNIASDAVLKSGRNRLVAESGFTLGLAAAAAPSAGSYYGNESGVMVDTTTNRPSAQPAGRPFYDTTLGKPITWNGSAWKDATGTTV